MEGVFNNLENRIELKTFSILRNSLLLNIFFFKPLAIIFLKYVIYKNLQVSSLYQAKPTIMKIVLVLQLAEDLQATSTNRKRESSILHLSNPIQ